MRRRLETLKDPLDIITRALFIIVCGLIVILVLTHGPSWTVKALDWVDRQATAYNDHAWERAEDAHEEFQQKHPRYHEGR